MLYSLVSDRFGPPSSRLMTCGQRRRCGGSVVAGSVAGMGMMGLLSFGSAQTVPQHPDPIWRRARGGVVSVSIAERTVAISDDVLGTKSYGESTRVGLPRVEDNAGGRV